MITSAGNGHHIGQADWYVCLTRTVIAPGHHRPVILDREAVIASARNGHGVVGRARRHGRQAEEVGAPGHHGSVVSQREAGESSARNRHHAVQARRHIGLAKNVCAPRDHGAAVLQGHAVVLTTGHGQQVVVQTARHRCLIKRIVAPAHGRSIIFQREAVIVSPGDGDHVAQTDRHTGLADIVGAPHHHVGLVQNLIETKGHSHGIGRHQTEMIRHVRHETADQAGCINHIETTADRNRRGDVSIAGVGAPLVPGRGRQAVGRDHAVQFGAGTRDGLGRLREHERRGDTRDKHGEVIRRAQCPVEQRKGVGIRYNRHEGVQAELRRRGRPGDDAVGGNHGIGDGRRNSQRVSQRIRRNIQIRRRVDHGQRGRRGDGVIGLAGNTRRPERREVHLVHRHGEAVARAQRRNAVVAGDRGDDIDARPLRFAGRPGDDAVGVYDR